MLRALPSYRLTRVPFEAWLFLIARNTVIDVVRREKRRARLVHLEQPSIGGECDRSYERIAERAIIEQCLAGLTRTQRSVIEMRFIYGHDVRTVATAIGRSQQATKSIQFRALTSMRRSLAAGPQANESLAA